MGLLAVLLAMTALTGPHCAGENQIPTSSNLGSIRAATYCLINRERVLSGHPALVLSSKLYRVATKHTQAEVSQDFFSHEGPDGKLGVRVDAVGYQWSRVGENIAWGTYFLATPANIVKAWMASPGHRANILGSYSQDGIAVLPFPEGWNGIGQPGATYTQDFASP